MANIPTSRAAKTTLMQRNLFTGNFRDLQARFIAETAAHRARDPLAPLIVLVTGQLVRMALSRELARAAGGHANIRFLTLRDWAAQIAHPVLLDRRLRTLPDVLRSPLLTSAIERAAPLDYFAKVAHRDGFLRVIGRTLDDLGNSDLSVADLQRICRRHSTSQQTHVRKLRDLTAIAGTLQELLREQSLIDTTALLNIAATAALADADSTPLVLYGFSALTPLQQRFFEAVIGKRAAAAYLPYERSSAYDYVMPLLDFLRGRQFTIAGPLPAAASGSALAQAQHRLFAPDRTADPLPDDGTLRLVSAPDRAREVDALTREVLFPRSGLRASPRTFGILLRNEEYYTPLLRSAFRQSGLQGYFHACHKLRESVAGRAHGLLAGLLDEQYRRVRVMEFLLSVPLKWPTELDGGVELPPVAEWNHFSLLAGITQGRAHWTDGLARLERLLHRDAERQRGEDGSAATTAARLGSLALLQRYLAYLFDGIAAINNTASWQARLTAFGELLSSLTDLNSEDVEAIEEQLNDVAEYDELRYSLTRERFAAAIKSALDAPATREGRFQVHEPTVAGMSAAFGLLFDCVSIPGLVEREVPRMPPQDPLLLDDEKNWIAAQAGRPLAFAAALRKTAQERERLLFHCALSSARERATLSIARVDTTSGRSRMPSHYLLDAGRILAGRALDYTELEAAIRERSWGDYIPAGHLQRCADSSPVTALQHDVALLAAALNERDPQSLGTLLRGRPLLARAVHAEQQRFGPQTFGAFDGLLEDESLRRRYGDWSQPRRERMSATRLERYATCPFQYFALHVLDLEAVAEPEPVPRLTPLQRGLLIHEILERFFKAEQTAQRLPLTADARARLLTDARRMLGSYRRDFAAVPRLLWGVETETILSALEIAMELDKQDSSGYIPRYFEQAFSFEYDVDIPLALRGKIDRIDIHPADGTARVIDYKSGKPRQTNRRDPLHGGRALQLPVYRLAVERLLQLEVTHAQYRYLASGDKPRIESFTQGNWTAFRERFEQCVRTVTQGMKAGAYFPHPDANICRTCTVKAACGAGRHTHKWAYDTEQTRPFRSLSEGDA